MSVRAKFKCTNIGRSAHWRYEQQADGTNKSIASEMQTIELSPVYSEDPTSENKKFWDATPSGKITLGVINPDAGNYFILHGEYYVDFTKAVAGS